MDQASPPSTTDRSPGPFALVFGVLALFFGVPAAWIAFDTGQPWITPDHGPLVREVLALPVPDSAGDLDSFFVDDAVARYIPPGTPADRAAAILEAQGFFVDHDTVTGGGFVDADCPGCTGEIEGWFREGRLQGDQVFRVWLGIELGRVRYVKGRRSDRPPAIQL